MVKPTMPDMANIDVQVTFDAWQNEDDDPLSMTRRILGAANTHLDGLLKNREITVRFASDAEVQALNLEFRKKDAPTNVLSFPAAPMPGQEDRDEAEALGDIILAYEIVAREASTQNKAFSDHACHLILHGVLHLLGYDHHTDEMAQEMESLERIILSTVGISDPYDDPCDGSEPVETSHVS